MHVRRHEGTYLAIAAGLGLLVSLASALIFCR